MKSLKNCIIGIVFTSLICLKVNAGWFAYRKGSILTIKQQESLRCSFIRYLTDKENCFSQVLKSKIGSFLSNPTNLKEGLEIAIYKQIYTFLICKERYCRDYRLIGVTKKEPVLQSYPDGLINKIIRETIWAKNKSWSYRKITEAYQMLWDSLVLENFLTLETISPKTTDIEMLIQIVSFVKSDGNNLCEKFANYIALSIFSQLIEHVGSWEQIDSNIVKQVTENIPAIVQSAFEIIRLTAEN